MLGLLVAGKGLFAWGSPRCREYVSNVARPLLVPFMPAAPPYLIGGTSRVDGRGDALAPSCAIRTLNRLGQDRATNSVGPAGANNAATRLPHLSHFANSSAPALHDCRRVWPLPPSISESAEDQDLGWDCCHPRLLTRTCRSPTPSTTAHHEHVQACKCHIRGPE